MQNGRGHWLRVGHTLAILHFILPLSCTISSLAHSLHAIKPTRNSTHSCLLSHQHLPFIMSLFVSLVLVFLAVALQASGQSTIEPQPYCHVVSGNFSSNPDYWLHATPVLRAHWWFDYSPLVRRQYADYWLGWKNISYLFALHVPLQEP